LTRIPILRVIISSNIILGIDDVKVKLKKIQDVSSTEVIEHFSGEKVDLVYSSHCFYFILGDVFKAALDPSIPVDQFLIR
jgi:hypothetical protein